MSNANDQVFFVGQKAFIRNEENKLLVLHDQLAGLDLPGGKVQSSEEDLKASLKREVKEETNLEIEVGEVFYTWRFHYPIKKVDKTIRDSRTDGNIYRVGFDCKLIKGDVNLSAEHIDYEWITPNDIDRVKSWGGDIQAIELFFRKYY